MYAVVEVGGMQWKVSKSVTIRVPKMESETGKSVELDRVLLVVDKAKVNIGKPLVPNAKVKATVLSHGKAKKVRVFKKKRRKNYKVLRGHRQDYTELRIDRISIDKEKKEKKEAPVKAVAKKVAPAAGTEAKKTTKKAIPKTKKASASAKSQEKKTSRPEKPVAKKAVTPAGSRTKKTASSDEEKEG